MKHLVVLSALLLSAAGLMAQVIDCQQDTVITKDGITRIGGDITEIKATYIIYEEGGKQEQIDASELDYWKDYNCWDAKIPMDDNGQYVIQEIVQAPGRSAEDLYTAAKLYFFDNFRSGKDVLQLDDRNNFTVIGQGWSPIYYDSGIGPMEVAKLWYKIKVESKNGRYRYTVYDMEYDENNSSGGRTNLIYVPFESDLRNGKSLKKYYQNVRGNLVSKINGISSSIKYFLANQSDTADEDW